MEFHSFLKLPAEVRQMILEQLLVPCARSSDGAATVCIDLTDNKVRQTSSFTGKGTALDHHDYKIHPQILRASHLMYKEGQTTLYTKNHFQIKHNDDWTPVTPVGFDWLKTPPPGQYAINLLSMFLDSIGSKNVSLLRALTFGDDEHSDPGFAVSENQFLKFILMKYPSLANLEALILDSGHFLSQHECFDYFGHYLNQLNIEAAYLDAIFDTQDYCAIISLIGDMEDCQLKWSAIRATNTMKRYLPGLTHIYEGACEESLFVMFSKKPVTNHKSRKQLRYTEEVLDCIPLDVNVQNRTVRRTSGTEMGNIEG